MIRASGLEFSERKIKMNRVLPLILFAPCLHFLFAGGLRAASEFSFPSLSLQLDAQGVGIPVRCSHDFVVLGFTVCIRYQTAALSVSSITILGTSAEGAEYFQGSHNRTTGEIIYGGILDLTPPLDSFLPPAADHTLMRLVVDAVGASGAAPALEFANNLGSPPKSNVLTNDEAVSVSPVLKPSEVFVEPAEQPPTADAGPDGIFPENAEVVLDATGSISQSGRPLIYQWTAPTGPQPLTLLDVPQPRFALPSVDADTPYVFELEVRDQPGGTPSTDRVTITAADLDVRKGVFGTVPGAVGSILPGGTRALLFTGETRWDAGIEDAIWTRMRFTARGEGDESALLSGLSLYLDSDADGAFSAADRALGIETAVASNDGAVEFTFTERIATGVPTRFFLVGDLAAPGVPAAGVMGPFMPRGSRHFALGAVLAGLVAAVVLSARASGARGTLRKRLAPLAASFILAALAACSSGGGGGGAAGAPAASRQVRFDVLDAADVSLQGAVTGIQGSATGLPVQGPALDV